MKLKYHIKRIAASALVILSLGITATAASTDDGSLLVTEKGNLRYFGTAETEWRIKFMAADGSGRMFYRYHDIDLNNDFETDIKDLIRLKKNIANSEKSDINGDKKTDAADLAILRKVLFGIYDFEI